jgi:acetoin utilization protein AcuB
MKLREIMNADVPTASPDESATTAWDRMRALDAAYLVVTKDGEVLGIVSWHDLSGPSGGAHRRMGRRVGELMRRDVTFATPQTSVDRAAATMRRHRLDCLPIMARGRLVGIVTTSDMLQILERHGRALAS